MVQIIQEQSRHKKGTPIGEQFSKAFSGGLQAYEKMQKEKAQQLQSQEESKALEELGIDPRIKDPKLIAEMFKQKHEEKMLGQKQSFDEKLKSSEKKQKSEEKTAPLQSALGIVEEMRNIRKKGNLGLGTSWSPFASTQKDAATYEQLGKSLISYASTIPIRNQVEFQTLAEKLYDPTITDAHAEGILDAMERIISGSLEEDIEEYVEKEQKPKKEKRPLTTFHK